MDACVLVVSQMVWDGKTENFCGAVSSAYHSTFQGLLFSDLPLSRAQSCSLAYLVGSPEIIATYNLQISDKSCWCSARVLDGHICECYTISYLSALLNKLLSSEQARTETLKVCSF